MSKVFRDPVSGFTHMGGAIAAIVGTVFLGIHAKGAAATAAAIIFGISMFLLFGFSATYHLVNGSNRLIQNFRKVDHTMIYIFIAGTYTPLIVAAFSGTMRIVWLCIIWTIAALGLALKLFFTGRFRTLSTILYIAMGWLCVFAFSQLTAILGFWGMFLLILGGVLYTIGAIIYALKWPGKGKVFGFHEVFHIFVLLGALSMFFAILFFL